MTIEVVKLAKKQGGFTLWIGPDQDFSCQKCIEELLPLEISGRQVVDSCIAPAEIVEEFVSKEGVFTIHSAFDEDAGWTIFSANSHLLGEILRLLLNTGQYHVRD
jgi:hypothetical protein